MTWLQVTALIEQLLPTLFKAIDTVEQSTGKSTDAAAQEVVNHLTPGQPNSPSLTSH